ncbi:hypothetical protein pb186bvf_012478 [Paramecium bursaria]
MNIQRPIYSASGMIPRQMLHDSYRQSFNPQSIDKENSYAQMQKRKLQQVPFQQVVQKTEIRPSTSQPRQPSVQAVPRPSSASTDKRSYSSQKQQRPSFKELKNSAFVQPPTYQRYYSIKQKCVINFRSDKSMIKSQSNQQLPQRIEQKQVEQKIDQQEYKKLHDKLQFLENKINKIKSNMDLNQKQSERSKTKPIGLAAKFFQKKEPTQQPEQQQAKSINLDQYVTQVAKPSIEPAHQVQQKTINNTISNLINKVSRHQSLDVNAKAITDKSYSSQKQVTEEKVFKNQQTLQFLYYVSSVIKSYNNTMINKNDDLVKEHLYQTIQGLEFAKSIKLPNSLEDKIVNLPKTNFQKTIVFDLDETLIHCNESVQVAGDVVLPISFPTGDTIQASVNIRPFAQQILQALSKHFEIIVFTASHQCYASVVLDYLDPRRQWISHRLYRDSCVQSEEGAFIKDLRVLGNRKLQNILLVDNASYSFGQQIDNGIPIIAYYDNKQDQELLYLQNYLMKFRSVPDVRELNTKLLQLNQFTNFQDGVSLLQTLFIDYLPM